MYSRIQNRSGRELAGAIPSVRAPLLLQKSQVCFPEPILGRSNPLFWPPQTSAYIDSHTNTNTKRRLAEKERQRQRQRETETERKTDRERMLN